MIYFDNSATTKPCQAVIDVINSQFNEGLFGNPGSLHKLGVMADKKYRETFDRASKILGCSSSELYFTSCGTESANTAIRGYVTRNKRKGNRIISTKTEHKATLEVLKLLSNEGYDVQYVSVGRDGKPNLDELKTLIDENTVLMCFTHVNNESGSILPIKEIVEIKNSVNRDTAIYLDCVQSLGKLDIKLNSLGVDMAAFSGHKIHSLKGVGMLYVNKNTKIDPFILGGGQQGGMRSGTQSLLLADAFVTALEEADKARINAYEEITKVNLYLREELAKRNAKMMSPDDALPFVLNVSFEGFESETMLHCLEIYDIFVSTVSACSSKTKQVSYVLMEMGIDRKTAANSVRLSFSRENTMDEAVEFVKKVDEIYELYALKR